MTEHVVLVLNILPVVIAIVGFGLVLKLCMADTVSCNPTEVHDAMALPTAPQPRCPPNVVAPLVCPDFLHTLEISRGCGGQMADGPLSHPEAIVSTVVFEARPTAAPWRASLPAAISPLVQPFKASTPNKRTTLSDTDSNAGVADFLRSSPPPDPQLVAQVLAGSEFELSQRRSRPAPRFSPSPSSSFAAEFARLFCDWLVASGASGQEFAHEDVYRLAIRFAGLGAVPLPQPDEAFFEALSEVRGMDKKPHRPCRVRGRPQSATTTYTVYGEHEVRLLQRALRATRRVRACATDRRSGQG